MHVVNAAVLERWNQLTDEEVVSQVLGGQTALFERERKGQVRRRLVQVQIGHADGRRFEKGM